MGKLLSDLNELSAQKEQLKQNQVDDHYEIVKQNHHQQELYTDIEQQKVELDRGIRKLNTKVDIDIYNSEIEMIKSSGNLNAASMGPQGKNNNSSGKSKKGMTVTEKAKFREMEEN